MIIFIKCLFLIFLINYLNNFINCQEINAKSNYTVKSINLLGTELEIVSGAIYFEEPIYILDSNTCPNTTCPTYPLECEPCDYTHKGCDSGYANRPAHCPKCNDYFAMGYNVYPCDMNWVDIEVGQVKEGFLTNGRGKYGLYRFYAPPTCMGYKVVVKTSQGSARIMVDTRPFYPVINGAARSLQSEEVDASVVICPDSPLFDQSYYQNGQEYLKFYPYGTIHIGMTNVEESDFIFKIWIEPIEIVPEISGPPVVCQNVSNDPTNDIQCLNDGQSVRIHEELPSGSFLKYSFLINQCKNITVSSVTLLNDVDIFATDDIDPSGFSNTNFKWASTLSLDDNLYIQVCPEPGQQEKIIYIGIFMYYKSDAYFYVSTHGQYHKREITDNPSMAGTWALLGTTVIRDMVTGKKIDCYNYDTGCLGYFPSYPRENSNPLYPVPGLFREYGQSLPKFKNIGLNETNAPLSNVYQYGLVISLGINGRIFNYQSIDSLPNLRMEFLNKLLWGNGSVITGSISIGGQVYPQCNYDEFKEIDIEQEKILTQLDDAPTSLVNGLRYYYDLLSFSDDFDACKLLAEQLIILNKTTVSINTTVCLGSTSSIENYNSDPCCSTFASFSKCCRKREQKAEVSTFVGVQDSLVEDQCKFSECAKSVLSTFSTTMTSSGQYDECSVSLEEESFFKDSLYRVFRECKSNFKPVICVVDQDCNVVYPGKKYVCNVRNGVCLVPSFDLDTYYIDCILTKVATPLKTDYLKSIGQSNTTNQAELIEAIKGIYVIDDCLTQYNSPDWVRCASQYTSNDLVNQNCYPYALGFDESAPLEQYDSCYQGISGYLWIQTKYTEPGCDLLVKCDWRGAAGSMGWYLNDVDALIADCNDNPPEYFCGDCTDPVRNCHSDLSFTTEQQCVGSDPSNPANYVCYHQDHDITRWAEYNLQTVQDPTLCSELSGTCDVDCGFQCDSNIAGCFIDNPDENCPEINGEFGEFWYGDSKCIYYQMDQPTCATNTGTYKSCGSFGVDQCTICDNLFGGGCDTFGLHCAVAGIPCTTKQECESSGICSDQFFFQLTIGDYPPFQPKCLFPRKADSLYSASGLPTCENLYQQDTPLGCFYTNETSINLIDKTNCEAANGYWWSGFKTTEASCNSYDNLCYGIDPSPGFLLPLTYRFNEKNQDDCECANEIWRKPFNWKQGIWTPGVAVPLKWIKVTSDPVVHMATYLDTFDINSFFYAFKSITLKRTSLLYKSEVLCRSSNAKNSLEALSCGCTDSGVDGDKCFDNLSTPLLKVIKPCGSYNSTYSLSTNTNNSIEFSHNSVLENYCVSISIGQIFKETFLSKRLVSLSSTFVSFEKPDDYSIFNDKKATIGKLLADGLDLQIFDTGILNFKVCMEPTIERNSKKNPIIDFATAVGDDTTNGQLTPLNCEIQYNEILNIYCCNISSTNSGSGGGGDSSSFIKIGKNSYFLVERIEEWQNENYKPFNRSSTGLLYTLAVFFTLLAIYGLLHIGFFTLQRIISTNEPFKLVHLLFLALTAFSIIRAIYFFVLPSGIITESTTVGNYILVVLPTFLYFTAFTIVIVIWYMLSNASSFNTNIYARINMMILCINIVLYVVFIVIILVFNFTRDENHSTCGGRLLVDLKQTTPQNVVSIFYAVLQACLSLVIGVAFIYYGRLIYNKLSSLSSGGVGGNNATPAPSQSTHASKQQNRTFIITILCSTGFVLHSIFIIILVSVNPSNIVFSFVGLIVTEMIPVIVLYVTNNQIPIDRYTKKGLRSVIKMKNVSYNSSTSSTTVKKSSASSSSSSEITSSQR